MDLAMLKQPSAFLPPAISLAALAIKWLPRAPRAAAQIVALQAAAALAALAPVFVLKL